MNWLHLSQTSSVRNTSEGRGRRLERVPGRSEQRKPWPGPPTWAAVISMDRSRGLADDYVTTKFVTTSTEKRQKVGLFQRFFHPSMSIFPRFPTFPALSNFYSRKLNLQSTKSQWERRWVGGHQKWLGARLGRRDRPRERSGPGL